MGNQINCTLSPYVGSSPCATGSSPFTPRLVYLPVDLALHPTPSRYLLSNTYVLKLTNSLTCRQFINTYPGGSHGRCREHHQPKNALPTPKALQTQKIQTKNANTHKTAQRTRRLFSRCTVPAPPPTPGAGLKRHTDSHYYLTRWHRTEQQRPTDTSPYIARVKRTTKANHTYYSTQAAVVVVAVARLISSTDQGVRLSFTAA